jgi:hypothetical protein
VLGLIATAFYLRKNLPRRELVQTRPASILRDDKHAMRFGKVRHVPFGV